MDPKNSRALVMSIPPKRTPPQLLETAIWEQSLKSQSTSTLHESLRDGGPRVRGTKQTLRSFGEPWRILRSLGDASTSLRTP